MRPGWRSTLPGMDLVKVCGITNVADARMAAEAGADAVGLIFAESPRRVDTETAREVSIALPKNVLKVGVFVNAASDEVLRMAGEAGLDVAQLHGDEMPEEVSQIRAGGLAVMKALRVRNAEDLADVERYEADLILLDAYSERVRGGTGETFDWGVAKSLGGRDNIVVSGGLGPENVRAAIDFFEPYGVDASSSLEDAPGEKNADSVRRFIVAAKG
jgi:phosphoribosylanthranilate isomerase